MRPRRAGMGVYAGASLAAALCVFAACGGPAARARPAAAARACEALGAVGTADPWTRWGALLPARLGGAVLHFVATAPDEASLRSKLGAWQLRETTVTVCGAHDAVLTLPGVDLPSAMRIVERLTHATTCEACDSLGTVEVVAITVFGPAAAHDR